MKIETLDLHLTKHAYADEKVRSFLNFAELPAKIITGNSQQMRRITISIIQEYGYDYDFESSYNFGALIINERSSRC